MTAWSNIFQWVVVGMSEVIAVGEYMNYWFPKFTKLDTWYRSSGIINGSKPCFS